VNIRLSRKLHADLLMAKQRIAEDGVIQRSRKVKAVSESAAIARSILRSKLQQFRESATALKASQTWKTDNSGPSNEDNKKLVSGDIATEKMESSSTIKLSYGELMSLISLIELYLFVSKINSTSILCGRKL